MFLLIFFILCLTTFTFPQVNCFNDTEAINQRGESIFRVYDTNKVDFVNLHRKQKPTLKFALHGTTVDKLNKKPINSSLVWNVALNDHSTVEFEVNEINNSTAQFDLTWHGGGPNEKREVCFHYGHNQAFWYNGYQSKVNASWPMDKLKNTPKQQFNFLLDLDRFNAWNNQQPQREAILILEHLFVNSDGFAVLLDPHCPWFISRNANGDDHLLCFSVNNSAPYMKRNNDSSYMDIKIHLFAGSSIKTVTDYVVNHSGYIPKPNVNSHIDEKMIMHPSWFTWEMSLIGHMNVLPFAHELLNNSFSASSKILLYGWNTDLLDIIANNPKEYPEQSMIEDLHKLKFDVGLLLAKTSLDHHVKDLNKLLINQTSERYREFIDFSNPEACKIFLAKLQNLLHKKPVNALQLFARSSVHGDFVVTDPIAQKYPSVLTTKYLETVNQIGSNTTIISEYGFKTQHLPIWVRLANYENTSYAQLLHDLIPNVLSVSMAGYSFIVPYSVGGLNEWSRPNDEIFIRMIQATALMPSISFTKKPWHYNQTTLELTQKFVNLHLEHSSTIIELAKRRVQDGSPIIRPMWYSSPDDPKTYPIEDQFMLGDHILVAPVLKEGQVERSVYFPVGTWIDQHGKSFTGPSESKVAAPLEELPFFKRKH